MKKLLFLIMVFVFFKSTAQVGIGTTTPNGLLDISVANPASPITTDGLLIPRVLAFPTPVSVAQNGMIVFLTTAFSGNKVGLYYYDFPSLTWIWMSTGNNGNVWAYNNANSRIDLPFLSNGTTTRPAGNEVVITDTGNTGIGTLNPTTKLDVKGDSNVTTGAYYGGKSSPMNLEIVLPIPVVVNNTIEIGNFNLINGAHNFRLTATASLSNFSVSKSYIISSRYNQTIGNWQLLLPNTNTGIFNADDFDIDINANNSVTTLRIRRKAGVIAGNISVRIENTGSTLDVFTPTIATATAVTPPTIIFNNNNGGSIFWTTNGNPGTDSNVNYIGTSDPQNLIFKTDNVQRLKIDNALSITTGTTGDVEIGNANSGTIRSNKELVLRQDGDVNGSSILRLVNRFSLNGAVFETGSVALVDFIFKTGSSGSQKQSNIRFETRGTSMKMPSAPLIWSGGNATELQFGQPDTTNGGPTLVVGSAGAGSNSSFRIGSLGIGNVAPTEKLDVTGNIKLSGALMPNNLAGLAGQLLVSAGAGSAPTWDANPAKPFIRTSVAGIYNVLASDYTICLASNATGVVLPSPVTNKGKVYVVIGISGLASITFSSSSSGVIFDDTTGSNVITIAGGQRYTVQSDGFDWIVIGR